MSELRSLTLDQRHDLAVAAARPGHAGGSADHFKLVVLVHVVVAARVDNYFDARALEQLAFLAEHVVLAADRRRAIEVVHQQHFANPGGGRGGSRHRGCRHRLQRRRGHVAARACADLAASANA